MTFPRILLHTFVAPGMNMLHPWRHGSEDHLSGVLIGYELPLLRLSPVLTQVAY